MAVVILTFTTLWAKFSAEWHIEIFFLFSPEMGFDISCKFSPSADNLHGMLKPVTYSLWKIRNILMSSAENRIPLKPRRGRGWGWRGEAGGGGGGGRWVYAASQTTVLRLNQTESPILFFFFDFVCSFLLLLYSTVAGVCRVAAVKSLPVHHHSAGYIFSFWDHWAHPGYFENRISLKPALGSICSLANYSLAYDETKSNR